MRVASLKENMSTDEQNNLQRSLRESNHQGLGGGPRSVIRYRSMSSVRTQQPANLAGHPAVTLVHCLPEGGLLAGVRENFLRNYGIFSVSQDCGGSDPEVGT